VILWHLGLTLLILWFVLRGNPRVDYRFAAFGALLPDLIDKPIGRILFRETFESGRLFGHTLLLNVAFLCVMFFLRGRLKRKLVLIPIGSLLHLAQDAMWAHPEILWWPLFGTEFPRSPHEGLLGFIQVRDAVWQEAVGLIVLAWLFAAHGMLSRKGIVRFLRTGRLDMPAEPSG
jgi:inner membrane protein